MIQSIPALINPDVHASTPATADITHPFWVFDWAIVMQPEVLYCNIILFFSGILCSAAGIGGGGIYVAVLMVVGRLSPHNAVPLSKAIVFFGAISSLIVNVYRSVIPWGTQAPKNVIDIDACRLIVPATLIGTFLGVLLNRHTSDYLIVMLLTAILGMMTGMVSRTARIQALEERCLASGSATSVTGSHDGSAYAAGAEEEERVPLLRQNVDQVDGTRPELPTKKLPSTADAGRAGILLIIVVIGGVLRFHMHACRAEVLGDASYRGACRHPVNAIIFRNHMETWMTNPVTASVLQHLVWTLPIWSCIALTVYYGFVANQHMGWQARQVMLYQIVAITTGLLAGLVGVGGGLIFSPFFLLTGMDPAVAVGTSATCVLFTSSSTTIQYIFTDRIIMSLAVVYGVATLTSSFAGTCLVHFIQDRFARKSYITTIVAVGVAISACLSVIKFLYLVTGSSQDASQDVFF